MGGGGKCAAALRHHQMHWQSYAAIHHRHIIGQDLPGLDGNRDWL